MSFTLEYNGLTYTLAEWGVANTSIQFRNASADTVTFTNALGAFDAEPKFPIGAQLKLYRDGDCIFVGKVESIKRSAQSGVYRDNYEITGPWSDLDKIMAVQLWTTVDTSTETEVARNQCRILFGLDNEGVRIATGAMLEQLIDNAIERGVAIVKGTILTGLDAPSWEESDITIAEAISSVLKWHPSAACWFDYTTPTPTLNIQLAADLPITEIYTPEAESIDARPRHDLVISKAAVIYERTVKYQEVTALRSGTEFKTTAATAAYWGWSVIEVGEEREFEALTIDAYPSDLDITAPNTLIHSVSWSDDTYMPPTGVAAAIVAESSQLFLDGSITFHSPALPFVHHVGQTLALSDVPAMWASALALPSSITLSISDSTMTIAIGPGNTLGVQDWIDLLTRTRKTSNNNELRIVSSKIASSAGAYNAVPDEALEPGQGLPEGFEEQSNVTVTTDTLSETVSILVKRGT